MKGKFESANGGTIFLDEIGELSINVQVKILRFLQEKRFNRVGGTDFISVDIRLITATNANLETAMERGKFREDLYYRLNVIPIHIPALRERPEDIPPLTEHFIQKVAKKNDKSIEGIDSKALDICIRYAWPGNVRELENAVENAVVLTEKNVITADDLPFYIKASHDNIGLPEFKDLEGMDYRNQLEYADKMIIKKALEDTKGNKTHAAKRLGFSIRTMRNKVNKYDL
jgi:transcriptional regulator with PAS, ATPase and Fis domain